MIMRCYMFFHLHFFLIDLFEDLFYGFTIWISAFYIYSYSSWFILKSSSGFTIWISSALYMLEAFSNFTLKSYKLLRDKISSLTYKTQEHAREECCYLKLTFFSNLICCFHWFDIFLSYFQGKRNEHFLYDSRDTSWKT